VAVSVLGGLVGIVVALLVLWAVPPHWLEPRLRAVADRPQHVDTPGDIGLVTHAQVVAWLPDSIRREFALPGEAFARSPRGDVVDLDTGRTVADPMHVEAPLVIRTSRPQDVRATGCGVLVMPDEHRTWITGEPEYVPHPLRWLAGALADVWGGIAEFFGWVFGRDLLDRPTVQQQLDREAQRIAAAARELAPRRAKETPPGPGWRRGRGRGEPYWVPPIPVQTVAPSPPARSSPSRGVRR
jgi:hypothetical protein